MNKEPIDQEIYLAAKKLSLISGFDFTANHYLLKTASAWIKIDVDNIKTSLLYRHLMHEITISLPIFNPTFTKKLFIDIDKQNHNVNDIINRLKKDFGTPYYEEIKYTNNRAHLYYEFNTPIFENAKKYLEKYYKEKYGYIIEANLKTLRLPWSKDYYKGAKDFEGTQIQHVNHLIDVFERSQLLEIPKFLKPFNKHGVAASKSRRAICNNVTNDAPISGGNRVDGMIQLSLFAASRNYTLEQYSDLCYEKNDGTSKDLASKNADEIISNCYIWGQENFNQGYTTTKLIGAQKPKEFLNVSEFEFNDKENDIFYKILKKIDPFHNTKYTKVKKRQEFDTLIMLEAIMSKFDYEASNPSTDYLEEDLAPLNDGIPIPIEIVKLLAEREGITNWKKIWKVVKSIFLESLQTKAGFEYSYCNIRYAIHYKVVSLLTILKNLLPLKTTFKNIINHLTIKNSNIILYYCYNICNQYYYNIFTQNMLMSMNLIRAGP